MLAPPLGQALPSCVPSAATSWAGPGCGVGHRNCEAPSLPSPHGSDFSSPRTGSRLPGWGELEESDAGRAVDPPRLICIVRPAAGRVSCKAVMSRPRMTVLAWLSLTLEGSRPQALQPHSTAANPGPATHWVPLGLSPSRDIDRAER